MPGPDTSDSHGPERRRAAARAGHRGDEATARALLGDRDASVRAAALGALQRLGGVGGEDLERALADDAVEVRRRGCEVAASHEVDLAVLLADEHWSVVDAAAWALGERGRARPEELAALVEVARHHDEPVCREAAVAALGAIGDRRGLPAILAACSDKPAVRRRAVLALAPFEGPEVDAALRAALEDRDWQVRQAAEDLLSAPE